MPRHKWNKTRQSISWQYEPAYERYEKVMVRVANEKENLAGADALTAAGFSIDHES